MIYKAIWLLSNFPLKTVSGSFRVSKCWRWVQAGVAWLWLYKPTYNNYPVNTCQVWEEGSQGNDGHALRSCMCPKPTIYFPDSAAWIFNSSARSSGRPSKEFILISEISLWTLGLRRLPARTHSIHFQFLLWFSSILHSLLKDQLSFCILYKPFLHGLCYVAPFSDLGGLTLDEESAFFISVFLTITEYNAWLWTCRKLIFVKRANYQN